MMSMYVHREEWIVMQLELTEKEFRRLLDMVYIGNWILNSCRDDDRFEDYDNLEEKLFSLCPGRGKAARRFLSIF